MPHPVHGMLLSRFRPQQLQQQRAKSVSVDHTGSSAFVPVADRLRLATAAAAAAAEERRRLFRTQTRRRKREHGEPERISESRGSSFQVSATNTGVARKLFLLSLNLARVLQNLYCKVSLYRSLKDEDAAATFAKDVNDDEDFGECDEVFHDNLCEEEVWA